MGPVLRISHRAFVSNIAAVRARIAPSALMVVMKDDAYGHGIEWATDVAARVGVDWFGSYDVRSGIRVRTALGERPARVFAWATSALDEVEDALRADVDLGVGTEAYLQMIIDAAARTGCRARVHLKIDTGLHRNGIRPEEWAAAVARAREAERAGLISVVGIWSHLAEASDAEDDAAQAVFHEAATVLRGAGCELEVEHLTASAASWWRPELRGSLCRIGAFCYGIRSADGPELEGVRPIARLEAEVLSVDEGRATVGIGSFDGVPSVLAGAVVGTDVGARELLRIAETTSQVAIWPGATAGDRVRMFGPGDRGEMSATALAERIDTVGEEVITRLTTRVRRVIEE